MWRPTWGQVSPKTQQGVSHGKLRVDKQLSEECIHTSMPSNAYIHYVTKSVPDIIRKNMIEKYSIGDELADLYMGLLMCT